MRFYALPLSICVAMWCCRTPTIHNISEWNPYQSGDTLIFQSSTFALDTIIITGFITDQQKDYRTSTIQCSYLENAPSNPHQKDTVNAFIAAFTSDIHDQTFLTINLSRSFARFNPFVAKSISHLETIRPRMMVTPYETYTDVLAFETDCTVTANNRDQSESTFVSKIYWSKSQGLVQYDLPNQNTRWYLKEKHSLK
jgi:hypothetical protein